MIYNAYKVHEEGRSTIYTFGNDPCIREQVELELETKECMSCIYNLALYAFISINLCVIFLF